MLVRKQLAHFNDALQGKTVSETPKKKGPFPFTQIISFQSTIILATLNLSVHMQAS